MLSNNFASICKNIGRKKSIFTILCLPILVYLEDFGHVLMCSCLFTDKSQQVVLEPGEDQVRQRRVAEREARR